jgi:peptide/nickel transport system substrate-binding protein
MKLSHRVFASRLVNVWLMIPAILFTLCIGPAYAASEPGTITIVLTGEPRSMDPGNNTASISGQVVMRNVVETLTESNPADSSVMPRLATSWKQIDKNTWQFFLRKGVKFHDGKDFNAEAVIFSIKRNADTRMALNTRVKFFSNVKLEGKALDNYTVEIKSEKYEPLMPTLMGLMPICSPNTPPDETRQPIGTGPYRFAKWDAGMQIVLERFDGYWGKQPQVKKAVYVWRNESAVRAAMVAIGEADLVPDIAVQDANRPDMDYSYLNAETMFFRFGGEWEPPLNDRRVRMALNYAVDRDAMRGSILSKDVVPATQIIGPNIFGYNPDLKLWPYDPKKARQLLDEARKDGVPVDKEILLVGRLGIHSGSDEVIEALMSMYRAVGLNITLRIFELGRQKKYEDRPFPPGPYITVKMHDNNKGDAGFTVYYNYHCKGVASSMCDKEVDALIEKAQVASGEERRSLWQAVFKRAHEEIIPSVVLFHMVGYCRVGKRINYKPSLATNNEIKLEQITFK